MGCHALFQGIFPTQGSNPGLLHFRQILYHLSHQPPLARIHLPMQKTLEAQAQSLGQEDPLEDEVATSSSILPEESHGQGSLVGYCSWGGKESDTTEHNPVLSVENSKGQ